MSDDLAERFDGHRGELVALAHRLLGTRAGAEDAVQEAWLRLSRVDAGGIDNLVAWLRTVVTRICLDQLRSGPTRRETPVAEPGADQVAPAGPRSPDAEAELADEVSQALLAVLGRLGPAERIAFVLHDMFGVPFAEIGDIVERTPATAKQLASRARRKVRGQPMAGPAELAGQRRVVASFLAAARAGDLAAIVAVLDPDVVRRADPASLPPGVPAVLHGATAVAENTAVLAARARSAELALVDGAVGLVLAAAGRVELALTFAVRGDRIVSYEVVADPERLAGLDIGVLGDGHMNGSSGGDGA